MCFTSQSFSQVEAANVTINNKLTEWVQAVHH